VGDVEGTAILKKLKGISLMNTWVKELLKNLDENIDEATKIKIMEACGEKCPFTHLPDE
jgi:ribosomal protein S3AE